MKTIVAFLKLIRWPNLFFITLTQCLFYYCIVAHVQNTLFLSIHNDNRSDFYFFLLVLSSILIAAAGYIINDYFDLQIDSINKPEKLVVDKAVKRRWAIIFHLCFSFLGIFIGGYISMKTGKWIIVIANFICVLLLWFYSTTFKRKLLTGNVMISLLTAWVIVVVYYFAGANMLNYRGWNVEAYPFNIKKLYQLTIMYAGFSFIISLVREVVKDLEDMQGDAQFDCQTIPITWGVPAAKLFVAVWLVVAAASLMVIEIYAWQSGSWIFALYNIVFIVIPLLFVLKKIFLAVSSKDYHRISTQLKMIMLAGIISMLFFKFIV